MEEKCVESIEKAVKAKTQPPVEVDWIGFSIDKENKSCNVEENKRTDARTIHIENEKSTNYKANMNRDIEENNSILRTSGSGLKDVQEERKETEPKAVDDFVTARSESPVPSLDKSNFPPRRSSASQSQSLDLSIRDSKEIFANGTDGIDGLEEFENLFADINFQSKQATPTQHNAPTTSSYNQFDQMENPVGFNPFTGQVNAVKNRAKNPFANKSEYI